MRSPVIKDEVGNPCTSLQEQQQRWRRHFAGVLNIQSQFDTEELAKVKQRPLHPEIAELPSKEEAVGKLKNAKAGRILPEMVKVACCEDDFLLDLVHNMVWNERMCRHDFYSETVDGEVMGA